MEELSIGEVARRVGVRTSTLRYYESLKLLPAPHRNAGGHRRYDPSVLMQLKILQMAQRVGCSLADMHLLVAGFSPETPASDRWKQLAQKKLGEVEVMIAHAQQTKQMLENLLQCHCLRLEECLEADKDESPSLTPVNEKD